MDVMSLVRAIPATFWGIVIGSLFTVVGVVLTNASNTRRLRIQHEHERDLESQERDLTMRREVYLEAIEAISAGMVAVGRFGDLGIPHHELMQSYTDKSPAIAKVNIVGKEATLKAVARFAQELTGTFLRLSSGREKLNWLMQRSTAADAGLEIALKERDQLLTLLRDCESFTQQDEAMRSTLQRDLDAKEQQVEGLLAEQSEIDRQLFPAQMDLVKRCQAEVAGLDRLLGPIIGLVRSELGLGFDEAVYVQIAEESNRRKAEYLEEFVRDLASDLPIGSGSE